MPIDQQWRQVTGIDVGQYARVRIEYPKEDGGEHACIAVGFDDVVVGQ